MVSLCPNYDRDHKKLFFFILFNATRVLFETGGILEQKNRTKKSIKLMSSSFAGSNIFKYYYELKFTPLLEDNRYLLALAVPQKSVSWAAQSHKKGGIRM